MSQSQRPKLSGTFLVTGGHGLTRVAYTRDFDKRMSEWQAASPHALWVSGMSTTPSTASAVAEWLQGNVPTFSRSSPSLRNPKTIHDGLKRAFADRRINGEWFALDDETINALPLERRQAGDNLQAVPPPTVLSINGKARQFAVEPQTFALPAAPHVWAAVGDAKTRVSNLGVSDEWMWLKAMEKHVIRWLVRQGRNDISLMLRFMMEYDALTNVVGERLYLAYGRAVNLSFIWDTTSWLVLQGGATFASLMASPPLLKKLDEDAGAEYETYLIDNAFDGIFSVQVGEVNDYQLDFALYLRDGGRAEDVAGWSAKRMTAEMDNGTFPPNQP